MPMTIRTGLSKKIGLRDFGSLGATCEVTFEVSHSLLEDRLDTFHSKVQNAFTACRQCVQDELAGNRSRPVAAMPVATTPTWTYPPRRPPRPATAMPTPTAMPTTMELLAMQHPRNKWTLPANWPRRFPAWASAAWKP